MRPITVSQTGTGQSATVPMDRKLAPFAVGIGCVVSGTATFNVEHTFDNIQDATVTPTWFINSGFSAKTANQDGNYTFPVRAIRLNVTAGTGTVTMTVIQGSSMD